jgi:hypothetical protein
VTVPCDCTLSVRGGTVCWMHIRRIVRLREEDEEKEKKRFVRDSGLSLTVPVIRVKVINITARIHTRR